MQTQIRLILDEQSQNQNQNSLLVKRQNDNTSPGDWPRKISPLLAMMSASVGDITLY